MIHMYLRGQLGNWLFQYALGRRLASIHRTEVRLNLAHKRSIRDPWSGWIPRTLEPFPLRATLERLDPLRLAAQRWGLGHWGGAPLYRERGWGYDPEALAQPDGSYLLGFFQSERYFAPIAETLRDELTPAAPDDDATADLCAEIERREAVSIHVRRGDYLRSPNHNVCTLDYYREAIRRARDRLSDPWFFVFSDDLAWCRAHLPVERGEFVDLAHSRVAPCNDLRLMSRCQHHIIANSTYSWWGAWLNPHPDKQVWAPGRWFGDDDMNRRALADTIPETWERVSF